MLAAGGGEAKGGGWTWGGGGGLKGGGGGRASGRLGTPSWTGGGPSWRGGPSCACTAYPMAMKTSDAANRVSTALPLCFAEPWLHASRAWQTHASWCTRQSSCRDRTS